MPEFIMPLADASEARSFRSLDGFTRGYVEAMFFTSCTPDDPELEDGSFGDLAHETVAAIVADCRSFQERYPELLDRAYDQAGYDDTMAGRDFWFTRNGHGVGFWDRKELGDDLGDDLTDCAKEFSEIGLYRGDDGRLYLA